MVEIIEPYQSTISAPVYGGIFVQSLYFIERRHKELKDKSTTDGLMNSVFPE